MSHPIDPAVMRAARGAAIGYARRVKAIELEDAIGVAYLKVAELAAKRPLGAEDISLVALSVKRAIIDWQRLESPLSRDEIRARSPVPIHVNFDDLDVPGPQLPLGDPWVRRAIMRLEPRLRDAVIACEFLGVTQVEHGRQIGRTEAMVSLTLRQAREQLKQFLADDFSHDQST